MDSYCVDAATRRVPLTQGLFALVDVADFRAVMKRKWRASFSREGAPYARADVYLHRFLLGTGAALLVDHINGDPLDNRRANLRVATNAQNVRNQKPRPGKLKGTSYLPKRGKWKAQIMFNYRNIALGVFDTEHAAARAYDARARQLYGDFARLNFPEEVTRVT